MTNPDFGKAPQNQQPTRSWIWIIVGIVVVGCFGVVAVSVIGLAVASYMGTSRQAAVPAAVTLPPAVATGSSTSGAQTLAQSIDNSGAIGFSVGDPTAPVTITEYADF